MCLTSLRYAWPWKPLLLCLIHVSPGQGLAFYFHVISEIRCNHLRWDTVSQTMAWTHGNHLNMDFYFVCVCVISHQWKEAFYFVFRIWISKHCISHPLSPLFLVHISQAQACYSLFWALALSQHSAGCLICVFSPVTSCRVLFPSHQLLQCGPGGKVPLVPSPGEGQLAGRDVCFRNCSMCSAGWGNYHVPTNWCPAARSSALGFPESLLWGYCWSFFGKDC